MLRFYDLECKILLAGKTKDINVMAQIKDELLNHKSKLDFTMTRFIEDFGNKLDIECNDNYHKFHKVKCEEYSKITRLLRIMEAVA